MKCKDCNVWGCQHRTSNAEQECVLQNVEGHIITQPSEGTKEFLVLEGSAITVDWQAFRREAAKDILCALIGREGLLVVDKRPGEIEVTDAICIADELIKQLKQE